MKTVRQKPIQKIIGVRELSRNMKAVSRATKRGMSYLVMRNNEPLFHINPVAEEGSKKKYTKEDLFSIRFNSGEKDLSQRIDEIVYGI